LEEREKMVSYDLTELNDMNTLLITRYQEHENFEADLDDEENSRSSRDRRRYTERIEQLEQQVEDLHREYGVLVTELQNIRWDRDNYHEAQRPSRQDARRVS
jgi:hypothetical protein